MLFLVALIINIAIPQIWTPVHNEESAKYKNVEVDYALIDAGVQNDNDNREMRPLTHQIIGYLPYWQYDTYPELDYELLTQINYFSAELDEYGTIINDHNWDNIAFIDYAKDRGVKVSLCATLFGSSELSSLLSNPISRGNAIQNLLDKVLYRDADGVDIDFELLRNVSTSL